MKTINITFKVIFATIAIGTTIGKLNANSVGLKIPANSFTSESHPFNQNIIRKSTGSIVNFIKAHPSETTYLSYDLDLMLAGATHLTVTAICTKDANLNFRIGREDGTDLASVHLTPTGNVYKSFTVPIDLYEIESIGDSGLPLYAVVDPTQTDYRYNLSSFKFEKSDVGRVIEAESYTSERLDNLQNDIIKLGNKVSYLRESGNSMLYPGINFAGSASSIKVRASSANKNGGTLVIYDGPSGLGKELGRVKINYTGSWNTFDDFHANINGIEGGTRSISLGFIGTGGNDYLFDIDHFEFNLNPYNNVDCWINAASYDDESSSSDPYIIRDMQYKVGYIKNKPSSSYEYFVFDNFDITGAKSVTIKYSSGGVGGKFELNSETFYDNTLASLHLPPTGGWNIVREVTVPLNLDMVEFHGKNGNLILSIPGFDDVYDYRYDIHSFRFNSN